MKFSNRCAFETTQTTQPIAGQPITGWVLLTLAAMVLAPSQALARVRASIVVDAGTGTILHEYHAGRRAHPASLTKLMTLYLTFQRLEEGKLTLDSRLHVSRHASRQQPTKLWLRPGSTITVRSAILGITTRSANDAAVVLAENIGGSEWHFARMMNREARRLGMTRTSFYNASGLPNARQWTTASDMSKLAIALIHNFPQYYHFFDVRSFRFHGHIVYGHDHVLDEFKGADGMKTGYVDASGYNLVTSAVRDHRRLVAVVLGGRTAHSRDMEMVALLKKAYRTAPGGMEEVARADHPAPLERHPQMERHQRVERHRAASLRLVSDEVSVPAPAHDWVIQVGGGFHSKRSVRRVLRSALRSAPTQLRHGHRIVVKLRGRRYRARFSQLSGDEARNACSALERKKYTCRILYHSPVRTTDIAEARLGEPGQKD